MLDTTRNVRIVANRDGDEQTAIVRIMDERRWDGQLRYAEDCGWEITEQSDTADAYDMSQDVFEIVFELGRDL